VGIHCKGSAQIYKSSFRLAPNDVESQTHDARHDATQVPSATGGHTGAAYPQGLPHFQMSEIPRPRPKVRKGIRKNLDGPKKAKVRTCDSPGYHKQPPLRHTPWAAPALRWLMACPCMHLPSSLPTSNLPPPSVLKPNGVACAAPPVTTKHCEMGDTTRKAPTSSPWLTPPLAAQPIPSSHRAH